MLVILTVLLRLEEANELFCLRLERHGCTFLRSSPSLVVDLGGGYMTMAQELLHFPDIDARIQQKGQS